MKLNNKINYLIYINSLDCDHKSKIEIVLLSCTFIRLHI